ncbi:MAG: creatininase family protein [Deltaproteobacteria bacterium]|nr:creatininase family protein [Deltaproteobacteria bacterium]
MNLSDLTMAQFEAGLRETSTAIVPLGSLEEHGGHLPLSTDTFQVVEVARRAAEQVPVFVAPPLHYGYCRSTRDHHGTVSIAPETLRRHLFDVGAGLYRNGIRGLILASGHAGGIHVSSMEEAAERLVEAFDDLEVAAFCEYRWAQEEARGIAETEDDGHAGEIETSRILALNPSLVRGTSPEEYPRFEKPFIAREKRPEWPGGVWGDPSKASKEKGEVLYERSAARLAELVRAMEGRLRARHP